MNASSNFYLLFKYYHCEQDVEQQLRFFNNKSVKKIENNSLQFTVWRYSGKSRVIVDMFVTAVIASVVHTLLRSALVQSSDVQARMNTILQLEQDYSVLSGASKTNVYNTI